MTVAATKKQIIKQIKKHGGLFENCGQDELCEFDLCDDSRDDEWNELNQWIESLDSSTLKQYL